MTDHRKRIDASDKVSIKLTKKQRKLIVDETYADRELLRQLRLTPVEGKLPAVAFTLSDWEDLQGHVAAASNHHEHKKTSNELLDIFARIQTEVFDKYNDQD